MRMIILGVILLSLDGTAIAGTWLCVRPEGPTELRDSPCGEGPLLEERRYDFGAESRRGTFNSYAPTEPPVRPARPAATSDSGRTPRRTSPREDATAMRCAEHEMRIRAINRRLRKGYGAAEGNELRAERRRIEELLAGACR